MPTTTPSENPDAPTPDPDSAGPPALDASADPNARPATDDATGRGGVQVPEDAAEPDDDEDEDEDPDDPVDRPDRAPILIALVLGLVIGLVAGAAFWALGPGRDRPEPAAAPAPSASPAASARPGSCAWTAVTAQPGQDGGPVKVGMPPAGERRSGAATLTVSTGLGDVVIAMDSGVTPCTVASLAHLAGAGFYDGDACDILSGLSMVACSERRPDYTFPNEHLDGYPRALATRSPVVTLPSDFTDLLPACPKNAVRCTIQPLCPTASDCHVSFAPLGPTTVEQVTYPAGTVLLGATGAGTNGGAFMICTREVTLDAGQTAFGTVTSGLDVFARQPGADPHVTIKSVSVSYS